MKIRRDLILATKPFTADTPWKSWWCIISTAALLIGSSAVTLQHVVPLWGKLISSVLSGMLIVRLFVIYHDHQHHATLPNSLIANIVMKFYGMLTISPSNVWSSSHNFHHSHNSKLRSAHIGSYPIMTKEQYLEAPLSKRIMYLYMRHPLTILFGYIFVFMMGMIIIPIAKNPKKHFDSILALVMHIAIGVTLYLYGGWTSLLLVQTLPHFIACAVGSYLFYAQHNFPGATFREASTWTPDAAALESSSFMKMSPVMHWFTANIGYHHVHHLNSHIPFHRLPEAMSKMEELQHPRTTSLSPLEIYRCLRLKVWDAQSGQLVGLNQI